MPADTATLRQQAEERLAAARLYVDDATDADVRFISGVLDYLDAQDEADEAASTLLNDIMARRSAAPAWRAAEATTSDDIDNINNITRSQRPAGRALIRTITTVWPDFRGRRCGVCGMTAAQAKAANHNCAEEC